MYLTFNYTVQLLILLQNRNKQSMNKTDSKHSPDSVNSYFPVWSKQQHENREGSSAKRPPVWLLKHQPGAERKIYRVVFKDKTFILLIFMKQIKAGQQPRDPLHTWSI